MNKRVYAAQFGFVAIILILLIEFPHGVKEVLVSSSTQSIHGFHWTTYIANLRTLFSGMMTLSFGKSIQTEQSVFPLVLKDVWPTISLLSIAFAIVIIIGIPKGIYEGLPIRKRKSFAILSTGISWIAASTPDFFVIISLVSLSLWMDAKLGIRIFFINSDNFFTGTLTPAIILAIAPTLYVAQVVRRAIMDQFGQSYMVTAAAKGLSGRAMFYRHVFPNCLPAIRAASLPVLAMLFSGLIVIEYLFYRHGIMYGLFAAMGNGGYSPSYGHPIQQATTITSDFNTFDTNLVIGYLVAVIVLFAAFFIVARILIRLAGYRGITNPYAHALREARNSRMNWRLIIGLFMLLTLLIPTVFEKYLPIPDPDRWNVIQFTGNQISIPPFPPSTLHWLGTDVDGRDLLSRAIHFTLPTFYDYGGLAIIVVTLAAGLAILSSLLSWRPIRTVITVWHGTFSLIPGVLGALIILELPPIYWAGIHVQANGNSYWGPTHAVLYLCVLGLLEVGRSAYLLQTTLDDALSKEYIQAAITLGASRWSLLRLHLWPAILETMTEEVFTVFRRTLILVAVLGFFQLRLGQAWMHTQFQWHFMTTSHEWGGLFSENARDFLMSPWVLFAPSLFITWTVTAFDLLLGSLRTRLRSK